MRLADLKPAPYNPRTISTESLEGLSKSLGRFGLVEPVVWNQRSGYIVGGHQRVVALRNAGVKEAQVVVIDLSAKEEKELNIALNNLSGDWDYAKLRDLLKDIEPSEKDREVLGFSSSELATLLKWGEDVGATPDGGVGMTPDERLEIFENNAIKQIVLYFKTEDYVRVLKRLKQIMEKEMLESHSDVFMKLLEAYDEIASRTAP